MRARRAAVFAAALLAGPSTGGAAGRECDALIMLESGDPEVARGSIEAIARRGGELGHCVLPHALFVRLPGQAGDAALRRDVPNIAGIFRDAADPRVWSRFGAGAALAAAAWNRSFSPAGLARRRAAGPPRLEAGFRDLAGPAPRTTRHGELKKPFHHVGGSPPFGAGFYDTSEYMIGNPRKSPNVAVGVIFPQSDGVIDPSTESWTAAEETQEFAEIMQACDFWRTSAPPGVALSFSYQLNTKVQTDYEPIGRPISGSEAWIDQVLDRVSTTTGAFDARAYASRFDKAFAYDNYLRSAYDTDWAFTVFDLDATNDADGAIDTGTGIQVAGYAYLGGPYLMVSSAYGSAVAAHEMAHIFHALDEYAGASSATAYSGYLDVVNGNHVTGGATNDPCLMRGAWESATEYAICAYTRLMIGWSDSDADGAQDITDTAPSAQLTPYAPDPAPTASLAYAGQAAVTAVPNLNPNSRTGNAVQVDTLRRVEYRVDSGAWSPAAAADGSFNGGIENFAFTAGPLVAGVVHLIEARATASTSSAFVDDTGGSPYASDSVSVQNPPPPSGLLLGLAVVPSSAIAGQTVGVTLTMTNSRAGGLTGLVPSLAVASGSAFVAVAAGPAPPGPFTLAPWGTVSSSWSVQATAAGAVAFAAAAVGSDSGSGAAVTAAASGSLSITELLAATLVFLPAPVAAGQTVTVRLGVRNTSAGAAGEAVGSLSAALRLPPGGLAFLRDGPFPAGPVRLAPGGAQTFTWTLDAARMGAAAVEATVSGTGERDGSRVAASATAVLSVFGIAPAGGENISPHPNPVSGDELRIAIPLRGDAAEVTVRIFHAATLAPVYRGTWRDVAVLDGGVAITGVRRWPPGMYLVRATVLFLTGERTTFAPANVLVAR